MRKSTLSQLPILNNYCSAKNMKEMTLSNYHAFEQKLHKRLLTEVNLRAADKSNTSHSHNLVLSSDSESNNFHSVEEFAAS